MDAMEQEKRGIVNSGRLDGVLTDWMTQTPPTRQRRGRIGGGGGPRFDGLPSLEAEPRGHTESTDPVTGRVSRTNFS